LAPGSVVPTVRFQQNVDEVGEEVHELAEHTESESENEEVVIYWQDKLFSSKEFDHYGDPLNCMTAMERKYNDSINFIKRFVWCIMPQNNTFKAFNLINLM